MGEPCHLNNNCLCAISLNTTGPDPEVHEIYEIAFIPMDTNYDRNKKYRPFNLTMRPDYAAPKISPGRRDEILRLAVSQDDGRQLFERWYQKLNLRENKGIMPLAHDWPWKERFIRRWMGPENTEYYFTEEVRDLRAVTLFLNDRAWFNAEPIKFPKTIQEYVMSVMQIENIGSRHALSDAENCRKVYKGLLKKAWVRAHESL